MVVLTATRRRSDGGPSARSLLISVLGQWVGPQDTPVWTSTLVGALESLGIEERAARQAVNRTAADGWLEGESVGRYTRWRLTESGLRMIGSAVPRVQRSIVEDPTWDGSFLLLTVTSVAPDRSARDRLAIGLDFEGFGALSAGVWIAASADAQRGAEMVLDGCGLTGLFWRSEIVGDATSPADVVAMAWDLDSVAEAHETFIAAFGDIEPADESEAFALRTLMAHEWRQILSFDPLLPAELLPEHWAGFRAREVFQRQFSAWAKSANSYYIKLSNDPVVS